MTPEELLKTRYKVIADFPNNTMYPVGKTVTILTDNYAVSDNGYPVYWCDFDEYPHIFKKIFWYEERKVEDMPEFIKHKLGGYYQVFQWTKNSISKWVCDAKIAWFLIGDILPCTKEEFENAKELEQTLNKD